MINTINEKKLRGKDMALNGNIKKFRKEAGFTQKELADRSGLSFSMISKLESGEQSNPSLETLKKIAFVLQINPGNLINIPLTAEEELPKTITTEKKKFNDKIGSPEESYYDLNFIKKLRAINTIPEPRITPDEGYADYLHKRPEMKKLFDASKNASKDEIEQLIKLIEAFRKNSGTA